MSLSSQTERVLQAERNASAGDIPFGVNEVRLTPRQWLVAGLILLGLMCLIPALWQKIERFDTPPDYRVPYELSKDYWLYGRRLRQVDDAKRIILMGDSVIWGEYVL